MLVQQTCQPVRILRSGHAFWLQSTQVRFVTLNYAKTWWRLCARTIAYLNQATAMKEDFDQSERWVHSPSSKWDDWQMLRPIIKKRLQIDSKTKSRSVSYLFTPAVWFLKRGQYTRYLQPGPDLRTGILGTCLYARSSRGAQTQWRYIIFILLYYGLSTRVKEPKHQKTLSK